MLVLVRNNSVPGVLLVGEGGEGSAGGLFGLGVRKYVIIVLGAHLQLLGIALVQGLQGELLLAIFEESSQLEVVLRVQV